MFESNNDGFVVSDLEAIAAIWTKNLYRMRQVYNFYAGTLEPDRSGRSCVSQEVPFIGHLVKKMMSFEDLRKFLKDFGLLPRYIDLPSLEHIFRGCKLWEWSQAYELMNSTTDLSEEESDLLFAAGNLSLSLPGVLELLSRLAVGGRLADSDSGVASLRNLLKLMDCSRGKLMLAEASRGSIVVKVFDTSVSSLPLPSDGR